MTKLNFGIDKLDDVDDALGDIDFTNLSQEIEEVNAQQTKTAKEVLISFLKDAALGEIYSISLRGNHATAKKFQHAMRVELSRFRGAIRDMGEVPKQFKIITDDIIPDDEGNVILTLIRLEQKVRVFSDDLLSILPELCVDYTKEGKNDD